VCSPASIGKADTLPAGPACGRCRGTAQHFAARPSRNAACRGPKSIETLENRRRVGLKNGFHLGSNGTEPTGPVCHVAGTCRHNTAVCQRTYGRGCGHTLLGIRLWELVPYLHLMRVIRKAQRRKSGTEMCAVSTAKHMIPPMASAGHSDKATFPLCRRYQPKRRSLQRAVPSSSVGAASSIPPPPTTGKEIHLWRTITHPFCP